MLSIVGNVFWLVSSFLVPLFYLIFGIIFFPLLPFLWPIIKFSFLPFGRELVKQSYLTGFEGGTYSEQDFATKNFEDAGSTIRCLANVIWPVIGIFMAMFHVICIFFCLLWCFTIVGIFFAIPNILAHIRMIPIVFRPFGRTIISSAVAKRLQDIKTEADLKKITG